MVIILHLFKKIAYTFRIKQISTIFFVVIYVGSGVISIKSSNSCPWQHKGHELFDFIKGYVYFFPQN
jgi:hypothetical protein